MRNSPHARLRPSRATAIGAATLLLVGIGGSGAPASGAVTAGNYKLRVISSGMAFNYYDPALPLQPEVAFGPYSATANLDNLGESSAQAGAPSLGDYLGTLTTQVNGLGSGQIPPFPPIPGEVRSNYPGQPAASERNGGYVIEATSDENKSTGSVGLGPAAPGSEPTLYSLSHAANNNGALKAVGSAGATLINIAGVLDIGRISSAITMTRSGSGAPSFVTRTDVGTITVSGQKFGLNQDGLTLAGSNSGASAAELNKASESLKQAGLSIRYLPATVTYAPGTKLIQSVRSGVVEVSYQSEVPSRGLVVSTYTFGLVQVTDESQSFGTAGAPQNAGADSTVDGTGAMAAPGATQVTAPTASALKAPAVSATSLQTKSLLRMQRPATAQEGASVAIVTPTLKTLRFLSTFGLPNGCNIFVGALSAGAGEAGAGDVGSAFSQGTENCTMLGNAGGEQATAGMASIEPLAAINPAIDPGIEAFAAGLESIGRDQRTTVSPFGPTLAGMANSARFFKGCGPAC